jgi:putative acetyltransferase
MEIVIRHAEPDDYEALHRIFSGPRVIEGTLQLPLPSAEMWRKRISEKPECVYALVACVKGEVVGDLYLETHPTRWRRRHVGEIGMAVRDDWQGKGVGTALREAVLNLADNWLNLTRMELQVHTDNAAGLALRTNSPRRTPPSLIESSLDSAAGHWAIGVALTAQTFLLISPRRREHLRASAS